MATPILIPTKPGFGAGTYEPRNTFLGLAGLRWSWETSLAQTFAQVDSVIVPLFPNAQPGIKPFGAAGDMTLGNITQGMTATQHAEASHLVQHAYALNGLGAAVSQTAADVLATKKDTARRTAPKKIIEVIKQPVRVNLRPLRQAVAQANDRARLAERENAALRKRVSDLERRTAHLSAIAIPGGSGVIDGIEHELDKLKGKVGKLGKWFGLGAFLLLLAKALEKIGGQFIRCSNTKKWGKNICGMNPSLLENLLADTLLIAGTIDLVDFALVMQRVTAATANPIRHFWRADKF